MSQEEKKKDSGKRKSPWWFTFAACVVYGAWKLLGVLWVNVIYLGVRVWDHFSPQTMAVSIGVIGGADGPTAIFVTTPPWMQNLFWLVLLAVGILGFLWLRRRDREQE